MVKIKIKFSEEEMASLTRELLDKPLSIQEYLSKKAQLNKSKRLRSRERQALFSKKVAHKCNNENVIPFLGTIGTKKSRLADK